MSEPPSSLVCPLCQATYKDDGVLEFCHKDGGRLQPIEVLGLRWRGRVLGERYEVLRFLGLGGMAEVYEAKQLAGGAHVALKLMRTQINDDPSMVERFQQEARLIGLIDHPNVVQLLDYGTFDDGTLYMAMELLHGKSLEELLERGPVDPGLALEIVVQVCEGLQAAHDKDIVHRDVKPANIFLQEVEHRDGAAQMQVKVLDLGIAKLSGDRTSNLTATGMVFGSPEYMSPEQALGEAVDPRADVYSLGVVLFHALFGSPPFNADSFVGVLTKQVTEAPRWPDELAAKRGLPHALEGVVMKALAKNRDHRQQSMLELCDELLEACPGVERTAELPSTARPTAEVPRVRPTSVRRVSLAQSGADLDGEVVEVAPDLFWVGRREGVFLERNIYLRVYRGEGQQVNVLIDPGPPKDLGTVAAKVKPIIGPLEKIDVVFLNHQDPDVAANAAVIQQLNPRAHVICSEDTWRLVNFYGLRTHSYSATEHFPGMRTTLATGHEVQFVPSPYCHFRGAVMYYDPATRVLLSGDLFGGLSSTLELVAGESALAGVEIFHQLYMPSRRALRKAVARVRALQPAPLAIAPQHGGIFGGDQLEAVLSRVEQLDVGADLFDPGDDMGRYLEAINATVQLMVELAGAEPVARELRCFSTDGTFPNIFLFEGDHRIREIKIEPRAALHAVMERARALLEPDALAGFEARARQVLEDHGLQLTPTIDTVSEPYVDYSLE